MKSKEQVFEYPKPSEAVNMFVDDMTGLAKKLVLEASPDEENVVGSNLFVLLDDKKMPYPAMAIPLSVARSVEERKEIVKHAVHALAKRKDIDVKVFVNISEAYASMNVEDPETAPRPSEDPKAVEVVVISAQDAVGNYKIKMMRLQRGEKLSLSENGVESYNLDWKNIHQGAPVEKENLTIDQGVAKLAQDGKMSVQDEIMNTAWREYVVAKMLAGANMF